MLLTLTILMWKKASITIDGLSGLILALTLIVITGLLALAQDLALINFLLRV